MCKANLWTQVIYQAGVNEKLLGDFIRKHNVRDKIFSMYMYNPVIQSGTDPMQLPPSAGSKSKILPSPTLPPISRNTLKELLND